MVDRNYHNEDTRVLLVSCPVCKAAQNFNLEYLDTKQKYKDLMIVRT